MKYRCLNRCGLLILPLALAAGVLAFLDRLSREEYPMTACPMCGEPMEYSGRRLICPECDL